MSKSKSEVKTSEVKNLKVSVFSDIYSKNSHDVSLEFILDTIKDSKGIKRQIEQIREEEEKEKRNKLKKSLAIFTPSGTFEYSRSASGLTKHSGLICIDIDNIDDPDEKKNLLKKDGFVLACFLSPSGNGLKVIIPIQKEKHKETWIQLEHYYKSKHGITIDPNPKSVSSSCFYSYDPKLYVNWEAIRFELDEGFEYPKKQSNNYIETDELLHPKVEDCISQLEEQGIDITTTHKDWLDVGFSLSHAFGEDGRSFYHRISQISNTYKKEECDNQYSCCLSSDNDFGDLVTIGTFFYMLKEVGIVPQTAETAETAGLQLDALSSKTPLFPDKVYDLIPNILKQLTNYFKGRARDIVLTSCLSVLSASFPNTRGLYRGKYYYSNLFTLIIAPSGSDKGRAELAKRLVGKIDKEIRDEYMEAKKVDSNILKRCHIIPGNTSSADIELILIGSSNGVIAESELDILSNNFNQEWGNFSVILRQSFEHESIARSRKDEDITSVDTPKLSVSLTGTFNQAPKFFDNLEDGLYNRFGIYTFNEPASFENPFINTVNHNEVFDKHADEVLNLYHEDINIGGSNFSYTKKQEDQFFKVYRSLDETEYIQIGGNSKGVLYRLAVQQFKIAMLLSKLRNPTDQNLICTEDDYQASFMIIDTFMSHTVTLYNSLKNKLLKLDAFYEYLPSEFTTGEAITIGEGLGIAERTIHNKLNIYGQKGALAKLKHGHYKKM